MKEAVTSLQELDFKLHAKSIPLHVQYDALMVRHPTPGAPAPLTAPCPEPLTRQATPPATTTPLAKTRRANSSSCPMVGSGGVSALCCAVLPAADERGGAGGADEGLAGRKGSADQVRIDSCFKLG